MISFGPSITAASKSFNFLNTNTCTLKIYAKMCELFLFGVVIQTIFVVVKPTTGHGLAQVVTVVSCDVWSGNGEQARNCRDCRVSQRSPKMRTRFTMVQTQSFLRASLRTKSS